MKYRILLLTIFTTFNFLHSPKVDACIHPLLDKDIVSKVEQSGQQALILHHNGVEDLVLKIDYRGENLKELGWVLPVPSAPDKYSIADTSLFQDLHEWVNLERVKPASKGGGGKMRSKSAGSKSFSPIRLLPPAKVGPFEIQPIQAKGAGAVDALNKWMKEHQFATFTAEQLSYYIDRDWTFLAVRITPEKNAQALEDSGAIPPLHVQFKSKEAIYPLKFSTHMGVFSNQITLITDKQLDEKDFDGARCRGFEVVNDGYFYYSYLNEYANLLRARGEFTLNDAPKSLQGLLKERFSGITKFHTAVLLNEGVNGGKSAEVKKLNQTCSDSPALWSEDLAIPALSGAKKQKPAPKAATKKEAPKPKEEAAQQKAETECGAVSTGGYFALLLSLGVLFRRRD